MQSNLMKLSAGKKKATGDICGLSAVRQWAHAGLGSRSTCVFLSHTGGSAKLYVLQTLQNKSHLKASLFKVNAN